MQIGQTKNNVANLLQLYALTKKKKKKKGGGKTLKIEQAKITVVKLWQLFPFTLFIYRLLSLTKPTTKKKKKKSMNATKY